MRKIPVGELVVDFTIYPRSDVDTQHVGYMVEALDAGVVLPPIIIDKATRRVVDGVHRVRAYQRRYGDDHKTTVIEKTYKTEAELFLDAIRYNAGHGRSLTRHDRAHCTILAGKMEIPEDELASALSMTVEKVGELRVGRVGEMHVGNTCQPVALKHTIRHMKGKTLTKQQCEANDRLGGMNQVFYVNQVITLIKSDLLDRSDANLMERLEVLSSLLKEAAVVTA